MKRKATACFISILLLATMTAPAGAVIANWLVTPYGSSTVNATFSLGQAPPGIICWFDAKYVSSQDYGDWYVGGPYYIDGDDQFIWLRSVNQWAATDFDCVCSELVICFGSDSNDGRCEVYVDNATVAVMDTYSTPGVVFWYIKVTGLQMGLHTVKVMAIGETNQLPAGNGAVDIGIDGAGNINGGTATESSNWGLVKTLY